VKKKVNPTPYYTSSIQKPKQMICYCTYELSSALSLRVRRSEHGSVLLKDGDEGGGCVGLVLP
jgi:hypothetical protein